MKTRTEQLIESYRLIKHTEGGWFSEVYTSSSEKDGRPMAGSIYYLLDEGGISHFHQIDYDEVWYFHEGCGMAITVLSAEGVKKRLLGNDLEQGACPMVVIPRGGIFAVENLDESGYSFVSCMTSPRFEPRGFRTVGLDEIREKFPQLGENLLRLTLDGR